MSPQQILTTVMTRIVVDKTIYDAKPHSIFFPPQNQRNEIFLLTIEHTDSDLKLHVLHYANDHGKLANQIVRLAAIVVKN